jgi:hypothetical protein
VKLVCYRKAAVTEATFNWASTLYPIVYT